MGKKILIIDDDVQIGNLEQEVLSQEGYETFRAYSGTEALLILDKITPDLVLLDLMLPGLSGEELLPRFEDIPVIVVSAKLATEDKVALLKGGAVDYITKPFAVNELIARVEVQLRRSSVQKKKILNFDDIQINLTEHTVSIGGGNVNLTKTEFAILKLLMTNPNQVITKSIILDRISEDTPDCTDSSLKTHISHLRSKLHNSGNKDYIEAVWGIGFKMKQGDRD